MPIKLTCEIKTSDKFFPHFHVCLLDFFFGSVALTVTIGLDEIFSSVDRHRRRRRFRRRFPQAQALAAGCWKKLPANRNNLT